METEDSSIKVIAGLGNPGAEYNETRHNVGFMVVDKLVGSGWRERNGATAVKWRCGSAEIWLVKPLRYMNQSGEPIRDLLRFYQIPPAGLLVVHDELDLPLGVLRAKFGGGSAGHNGVRSIEDALGTNEFARIRIGIGRPLSETGEKIPGSDKVLGRFLASERGALAETLDRSVAMIQLVVNEGILKAQNRFH